MRVLTLIRLSDEAHVGEFCRHFRRSGFDAEPVGGVMVEVTRPGASTRDEERREIEAHLVIWHVGNPDSNATPVD